MSAIYTYVSQYPILFISLDSYILDCEWSIAEIISYGGNAEFDNPSHVVCYLIFLQCVDDTFYTTGSVENHISET